MDEASAIFDGDGLLISLVPSIQRCDLDLPGFEQDTDEVPVVAGLGGAAAATGPFAGLIGGLGLLFLAGGGLMIRRNRR